MQKKTLLFAVLIFGSSWSFSQNIGVKAGFNYVNNTMDLNTVGVDDNNSYRLGYHFGAYGKFTIKDNFFIQPEIIYSNKGLTFDETAATIKTNLHLNYINLPILIGFQAIENLGLVFGPELGFLLSAKSKSDAQTANVEEIWDNKFDFGLAVGLGHDLSEKINVGLRYTHGLSTVIKDLMLTDEIGNPIGEVKARNRAFQLSLGYKLR